MSFPPTSGPTSVTNAYAVLPMKATSIAPPIGAALVGNPLANVVVSPGGSPLPERPRVIVADDHPRVQTALRRLLEPHCDVVSIAIDGEDLLRQVGDVLPDVVVTDINMPRMNGLDACRHIRRTYPSVSVVIVTGLLDDDLAARATDMGASAVVHKMKMAWELPAVVVALPEQPPADRGP